MDTQPLTRRPTFVFRQDDQGEIQTFRVDEQGNAHPWEPKTRRRRAPKNGRKTGPKRKLVQLYLDEADADMLAENRGRMACMRAALFEAEPTERDTVLWLMRLGAQLVKGAFRR